ncbi:TetR/AcrR family transcriptional regulator [Clostridium sp. D2Q-14]|uniref:TetR/AcrR family transcriptional regulator n=1 Tax=Anaeromonas gelatinilytica TaxID=2683194 RepID=UPI00193C0E76|nr:TetR/AcrR family transcriptional regulator [Anaeromonas gelatinilytica]MBS4536432.1 TetR/AcrR family transcriptional regulator [Anaeromonas gelatinilytica]
MPKIINDVEQRIYVSSLKLFSKYGYKDVDIKIIARESGIAVGTLYNYYPNKKNLFRYVFNKSWTETFERLDEVINLDIEKKKKLNIFVETLYEEILNRKGMGNELIQANIMKDEEKCIKIELLNKIKKLLFLERKIDSNLKCKYEKRFLETILVSFIMMMIEHPNEKEENIDYLSNLLWNMYSNIEKY